MVPDAPPALPVRWRPGPILACALSTASPTIAAPKGRLHRHRFGHDFAFQDAEVMFGNMTLLVDYINAHMASTLSVRYGTLTEYFTAVGALPEPDPAAWPIFTEDYVPFEDNPWAGWWVRP